MILASTLSLLLAATPQQPAMAAKPDGQDHCSDGMNIRVADAHGIAGSNVELRGFEQTSPDDRCVRNIRPDEFVRLHQRVMPIATKAFANSAATFGVMVRYTLRPDKPASFNMKIANAPPSEKLRLDQFYRKAGALTDFHSTSGTVYVLFQFNVTPARQAKRTKAH